MSIICFSKLSWQSIVTPNNFLDWLFSISSDSTFAIIFLFAINKTSLLVLLPCICLFSNHLKIERTESSQFSIRLVILLVLMWGYYVIVMQSLLYQHLSWWKTGHWDWCKFSDQL